MKNQSSKIKSEFTGRSNFDLGKKTPQKGEGQTVRSFKYFGISPDSKFVRRFKLCFKTGRTISIPYAFLPLIDYQPDQNLVMSTGELTVTISGRSLSILEEWLTVEKVIWIKESESGIDDEASDVFVENIQIEGELLI